MEHEVSAHQNQHPPTTIRQYVMIGVVLTVITVIELWLSYSGLPHGVLIGALIAFSALKFLIVVALFMHLRFDNALFWRMFMFGLVLASALLLALIALFWGDHSGTDLVGGVPEGQEQVVGHGGEGEGEGSEGEGGAPTGDPAAGMVQGVPVGDFYSQNCAACHGQNREGLVGPALVPSRLTEPDAFYHDTIANGRPGTAMPSWTAQAGLTDADIDALVQFIKHVEP